jgi:hypothetical protein
MEIEDDFYATIKLKTGEEIFAKVAATEEDDRTILLISSPIIVNEFKSRSGTIGYKIDPWLKTTKEDLFIIDLCDVLTMTETDDLEMIMLHQSFIRNCEKQKRSESQITKEMGYVSNVNDAKELLERIYNNSFQPPQR